jgi:uronate dehydrogenase
LTQLIVKSIKSDVRFAIFIAVSNNPKRFWDISNAQQLVGYEPQDSAADYFIGEGA